MSKKKLFDEDSDEEVTLKTENEYAKKYDSWREKEELHKLEQKYGSKALDPDASLSSDSEDEDDEPPEVSEEMEAQFLKTLALLKTKDPRIYDPNFKFFDEKEEKVEEEKPKPKTLTFEDSDDDSDDDGNIFRVEKKAEIDGEDSDGARSGSNKSAKEGKLKAYLTGKAEHINDPVEKDLAPLKALWSDPALNEGEAFLRDYILNKRYLEEGEVGEAEEKIRDDEALEEDEKLVEEQGKFERAYNFRFEEPDQEYLKRFPRTMNYIRPKDDKRAKKRAEIRQRKEEEKKKKMEEIARMKALKLKEIQEKIAKIKEVTGNQDLAFKEEDIEGDFDPAEHDRRMRALFDEQFYGDADDEKPVFPDLDEELEIENWDKYAEHLQAEPMDQNADGPHCEDDEFNMDADYDPKQARANLLEEIQSTLNKRRNRKKKSKLAKLLEQEKPKFVPNVSEKTYNEYMEEYYKMDCEDVIAGELPTRFKYREVEPNDFGLTVEEILLADDKELTQWVPLKKIVKHRPADVEKSEVKTYRLKAADERLKKKILPSLFKDLPQEPEIVVPLEGATKKKKKKKKNKEKLTENPNESLEDADNTKLNDSGNGDQNGEAETEQVSIKKKRKKDKGIDGKEEEDTEEGKLEKKKSIVEIDARSTTSEGNRNEKTSHLEQQGLTENIKTKKKKNKLKGTQNTVESSDAKDNIIETDIKKNKYRGLENTEPKDAKHNIIVESQRETATENSIETNAQSSKKKRTHKSGGFIVENVGNQGPSQIGGQNVNRNLKRKMNANNDQGPSKKKNKNFDKSKNKFNFKQKGFKNKQSNGKSNENPLSKLSDERLKAYGLNPKKYRSFLKYKKF